MRKGEIIKTPFWMVLIIILDFMSVILEMAKQPGINSVPLSERKEEINRRCLLLYQEREESKVPVTHSHIAAVLGIRPDQLTHYKGTLREAEYSEKSRPIYLEVCEAINAWVNRFDALTQDIMSTTEVYQPAMYLLKSLYRHSDRPDAAKETVTVSYELVRGEIEKVKAEFSAGLLPNMGLLSPPATVGEAGETEEIIDI